MNRIMFSLPVIIAILFFSYVSVQSQSSYHPDPNTVIASLDGEDVYLSEMIDYYQRNNVEQDYTAEDLRDFLPFYIDYKLKLIYGEKENLHDDPGLQEEFKSYSKQAAISYWIENEIKKQLVDEFIQRSGYEMKSHHVLIRLSENSSAEEEENARKLIDEAKLKYENGEMSMEELDQAYSTKMRGQSAGGELPWFSAGVTVKPFEDTLYSLDPGELSDPVRTQFGYHLIYLIDRRERTPDRKVRHIFFRDERNDSSPEELANQAFEALEEGRPWNETTQQFSHDGASSTSGGDIGWVGYGTQFSNEFIEAVLSAEPDGSYTEPVQTNYGYHIFRIDSVRTYQDEEHKRHELTEKLEELPRYSANQSIVYERIAEYGNLQTNDSALSSLDDYFETQDSTVVTDLRPRRSLRNQTIITFDDEVYNVSDFINWLAETDSGQTADAYSRRWIESYEEHILDSNITEITNRAFPEFENEVEGFMNGLVVFQISDMNIWNSETADSTGLKKYYDEHAERYQYDQRYDYTLLASRSDSVLSAAIGKVKSGEDPAELPETMDQLIETRDSVSANGAGELLEQLDTLEAGDISEPFDYKNRKAQLILHEVLSPRQMTFDEAFHRVSSDYQPIREENFLNSLRDRFDVETYPERIQ